MYRLRLIGRRASSTARALPEIARLARWRDHRLMPAARKPAYRRFLDLTYISLRWGEVSSAYYGQGVDRVGRRVRQDFISYPRFRQVRDSRNRCREMGQAFDYVCLLQDKRLFERYFGGAGLPVIPTIAELRPSGVELAEGECRFADLPARLGSPRALFCKPRHGIHGDDAFRLDVRDDGLRIDGEPATADALAARIRAPFLCQELITQHADLERPHPASVNTLRIVTVRHGRTPEVLLASLKLGADGAVTDNGGETRCVVRVQSDTGRFYETGIWRESGHSFAESTEHRQTGVQFRDCAVPYFTECLEIVRRAHDWLPGVYSVGWDLAITPQGPVLLEGNDDWSGSTSMNYADIRRRFLQLHGLAAPEGERQNPATRPQTRGVE